MKYLIALLFVLPSFIAFSQELPRAVKKVNPSLFVNNMENERIYQQANIRENLVVFSRGFENRPIEEIQQSFHYRFLDAKEQSWLLELRFDRHDIKISNGIGMEPIGCNDFGFKIYKKHESKWKDVTFECLPDDFLVKITKHLPELQKGSFGVYFYNQVPEQNVQIEFDKMRIYFKQNGKNILNLHWKKEAFSWKK